MRHYAIGRSGIPGGPRVGRRGLSFVYAVVVLGAMLTLGLVFLHMATNSTKWAHKHAVEERAGYLAESGVHRAVWMMQASQAGENGINNTLADGAAGSARTYTSSTWAMAGGRYWFVATAPYKNMPYTVAVRGVGLANDGPRDVRVEALAVVRMYSPRSPGSGNPASYVPYAVFSNKDGEFKDRSKVIAHPEDGGKGMYVNGKLKIGGKPTLTGDLSVTGKISGLNKLYPKPWGVYKRTQRAAREPMPEVDLAYYRSIADEVYSGDLVLGTGKKATSVDLSHPTVIYVDGKLTIKGKLKGVGIIVAAKGVKIEGDVTYDGGDACWAIISADKVKIKNGAKVYGGIYAHSPKKNKGRIDMAKNSEVVGFVVGDRVKLKKDAKVEWDPRIAPMAGLPGGLPIGGQPLVDVIAWGRL